MIKFLISNPPTLISSRRNKVATNGFERLEHQLGLDINKIDLENLCELPKPILQQVEATIVCEGLCTERAGKFLLNVSMESLSKSIPPTILNLLCWKPLEMPPQPQKISKTF